MNKEFELSYLAGALDGDGSFSLMKGTSKTSVSPLYFPMIQFANAKREIIDLLIANFGGSQGIRAAYKKDGISRKASNYWKLEKSIKCLPALEQLIPYLIIKKQRAAFLRDYIIDNPFIRGSNRLSDNLLMNREKSYLKMRSFNDNAEVNGLLYSKSKRQISDDNRFWAYIAGLMDTDGSFSLKKENRTDKQHLTPVYTPTILLTMTDCRAVYYLMNNFIGGNLIIVKAKTAFNGFCYRFSITSRKNAIIFLQKCLPFLLMKKNIALKLLQYCESVTLMNGKKGVSKEEVLFRENYYIAIRQLNNGVYKSPLMDLKPLPDNAGGNKAEGNATVNVVSEETPKGDAVL